MKTILITGCSSGFGLEIARYFLDRDWNVVATMRSPRHDLLPASSRLRILPLDVADEASIRAVVAQAGPVDVLVNNAGIGALAAVEAQSPAQVREIFETNTLGSIAMCQAFIPQMRERAQGVVINVTSSVTLRSLPLLAVYTASKAAVNAFTESMALELASVGVQARLVLPGRAPSTRFAENARPRMEGAIPDAYGALAAQVFANFQDNTQVTHASDVAEAVWQAATDPGAPMRIPAGEDAREWAATVV
ncbi:short-chain alcohol dehydrogenase [Herbaspirillum frisingense GSF30]|uniref:Short-chain alcohol dehydrogenase n=1 Tax=Herbaspirillum frisingense GSF30 TaxID=864073 RepID=A0AAI9IH27_9BURK|nr:SDR family oxidoreductase [Herbaspirillum frisingense]EOA05879.1 short-chain alcohol dehydrogenase [Herbaspirillum frisingense GSF30]